MKSLLLFSVVVTTGLICVSLSKVEGVVYYVSPTEQLSPVMETAAAHLVRSAT